MDNTKPAKRVGPHSSGTLRAAVRPTRRESAAAPTAAQTPAAAQTPDAAPAAKPTVTQIVESFARSLLGGTWSETYWGKNVAKKEAAARKHFRVPDGQGICLVLDTTIMGSCKVGFALTDAGMYLRDERGERAALPWRGFSKRALAFDGKVLTVDDYRFLSKDGEDLCRLLKRIQREV